MKGLGKDWGKESCEGDDFKIKKEIENTSGRYDTATKKQMIIQFREMNTELSNKLADELEKELSITCS